MRVLRNFFSRRLLGVVPGWLALILVLGGMAVAAPPVFHGNVFADASQNQSGGSGTVGPVVVSQATAQPTMQPGNTYVQNSVVAVGQSGGLWQTCVDCTAGTPYNLQHYHMLWVSDLNASSGQGDIALGGAALASGDASTTGLNEALGIGVLENKIDQTAITGAQNLGVGYIALGYLKSGSTNVAMGNASGLCLASGSNNTGVGANSLGAFDNGSCSASTFHDNVAVGEQAGQELTTGSDNVFSGAGAGKFQTTATNSVLVGFDAGGTSGFTNSTGNTYVGYEAGFGATGIDNTILGVSAGGGVLGNNNIVIGQSSGPNASGTPTNSIFIGRLTGHAITTSSGEVFMGDQAGKAVTSGANNLLLGNQAGVAITSGASNVVLGPTGCATAVTSNNNVCIGNASDIPDDSGSELSIQNALYGRLNSSTGATVSTGCLSFYSKTCTAGTVNFAVPLVAANGAAASCTGGYTFLNGIMVITGAGAPTCTAPAASEYLRSDGASGSHIYISQGAGTWTAISGV